MLAGQATAVRLQRLLLPRTLDPLACADKRSPDRAAPQKEQRVSEKQCRPGASSLIARRQDVRGRPATPTGGCCSPNSVSPHNSLEGGSPCTSGRALLLAQFRASLHCRAHAAKLAGTCARRTSGVLRMGDAPQAMPLQGLPGRNVAGGVNLSTNVGHAKMGPAGMLYTWASQGAGGRAQS